MDQAVDVASVNIFRDSGVMGTGAVGSKAPWKLTCVSLFYVSPTQINLVLFCLAAVIGGGPVGADYPGGQGGVVGSGSGIVDKAMTVSEHTITGGNT